MNNILGTLIYRITGDSSMLNSELSKSQEALRKTSKGFDDLSQKALKFGSKILTGVLIKSLADAASRLEELNSKFNTVFKGIEVESEAWVETYADATSRGIIATKEFMATQQDLRTGYGDTTKKAAEYSKAVVGVTNDLASFSNVKVEDAMTAIQSGLNGEFMALRRLGVSLNVATLDQMDYAKSIGKTYEEMSALEKQEAILSGIMAQSKNALHQNITLWQDYNYELGDAAQTSDSFANTQQGFNQILEDTKAALGEFLLPSLTSVLGAGKELLQWINSLPSPIQAATTAILSFGAALVFLGTTPIGMALSTMAGLIVLVSGLANEESKLEKTTSTLAKATTEYNTAVKALEGDTSNLSEQERVLYENRKKLAELKAKESIEEIAKEYTKTSFQIKAYGEALKNNEAIFKAYNIAVEEGIDGINKARKDESLVAGMTSSEIESFYLALDTAAQLNSKSIKAQLDIAAEATDKQQEIYYTAYNEFQEQILKIARSVQSGIVDISYLEKTNKDLYDSIMECVEGFKDSEEIINDNTEATEKAIKAGKDWSTQLKNQKAELAKQNEDYRTAAFLKANLLRDEEKEEKRALATKLGLIKEEEDITTLSIEEIEKRIRGTEGGHAEILALEEYYRNERQAVWDEYEKSITEKEDALVQKRKESAGEMNSLYKEIASSTADEADSNGNFNIAHNIRMNLLKDEANTAIALMEEKVAKGEATELDLSNLKHYYSWKEEQLIKDKNDKIATSEKEKNEKIEEEEKRIADLKKQNSDKVLSLLESQRISASESAANELENLGDYEKAYTIRLDLLKEEAKAELESLQEKIDNNEATLEDLNNLQKYYDDEEIRLNDEKNKKIEEADKIANDKKKDAWKQVLNSIEGNVKNFYGSIITLAGHNTERQIEEINKQTEAKLKALGLSEKSQKEKLQEEYEEAIKNGDKELAQEKMKSIQKAEIEEEADERIKRLQREQAEREKQQAIFTTTLDMLSSVIKFLVTPGGWQGLALSAMAAATGGAQIAAIKAQPLPSYDVGSLNISEDHIAKVHQGEMIIPKSFAESLRQGDISLSKENKANVQITIINNTSSLVETEKTEENGIEKYTVIVGKVVDKQLNEGRFDNTMLNRFGVKKRGF